MSQAQLRNIFVSLCLNPSVMYSRTSEMCAVFTGGENKGTGVFTIYFPLFGIKYLRECCFLKTVFTSVTVYRLGLQIFMKYLQNVVVF